VAARLRGAKMGRTTPTVALALALAAKIVGKIVAVTLPRLPANGEITASGWTTFAHRAYQLRDPVLIATAPARRTNSMKNVFSGFCAHIALVSCLGASPFFGINVIDTKTDPLGAVIDALNYERNIEANYEIESRPGPDFLAYRIDGGLPVPEMDTGRLLELNTFKASQDVIWNTKAFHLISTEKNNGITIERQRLLSSDGLLVDYYPERPSAYIRKPDHVASQFSLVPESVR